MNLKETVELMTNSDYKERFKGEYWQLKLRMNSLRAMLEKYEAGTLDFTPSCSYELLNTQLKVMETYAAILEERARIEQIDLNDLKF